MKNNILNLAIMLTVGVILAGSLLMPVISDAQHANDTTYTNEAPYSYGKIYEFAETDEGDTVIITVCKTGDRTITINGVTRTVAAWQPVVLSDGFTIRFFSASMNLSTPNNGSKTVIGATITISDGVASFSNVLNESEQEITMNDVPISWAFVNDPAGDYTAMITEQGVTAYTKLNEIYSSNWIITTSEYFSGKSGENFVTITDLNGVSETASINWGGEYLNNGVYKLTLGPTSDDYTFTVDNNGTDYTVHPFIICVPKTVVGTPDDVSGINTLYELIPVFVIISLLMSAVGAIYVKRND